MRAHQDRSYGPVVNTHDRPTPPPSDRSPAGRPDGASYEVRVDGHLGARWAAWFDGFDLVAQDDGTTVLRGAVADQAALHGLLHKLRDLGISLLSLSRLPADPTALPDDTHRHHTTGATS
jgi:hypothetical protein